MRRTEKLGETEPKAQFPSKGKGLDDDDDYSIVYGLKSTWRAEYMRIERT